MHCFWIVSESININLEVLLYEFYLFFLLCTYFSPVPSYNWTRRSSGLPRNAILSNYNRVITLRNVSVEDQGEYICRATNSRLSIENSVTLSIQGNLV